MPDVERAAITEFVYRRMADPSFRRCLTATAPDGSKPIVVALKSDRVRKVLHEVDNFGGAANVVIPLLNGAIVVAMQEVPSSEHGGTAETAKLTAHCTVGVLLERLTLDGDDATYTFVADAKNGAVGRAEVVGVAG